MGHSWAIVGSHSRRIPAHPLGGHRLKAETAAHPNAARRAGDDGHAIPLSSRSAAVAQCHPRKKEPPQGQDTIPVRSKKRILSMISWCCSVSLPLPPFDQCWCAVLDDGGAKKRLLFVSGGRPWGANVELRGRGATEGHTPTHHSEEPFFRSHRITKLDNDSNSKPG